MGADGRWARCGSREVAEGWAPFQKGRWRWYDALGYTWVSDEAWGWVPYHYGRWTRKGDLGLGVGAVGVAGVQAGRRVLAVRMRNWRAGVRWRRARTG